MNMRAVFANCATVIPTSDTRRANTIQSLSVQFRAEPKSQLTSEGSEAKRTRRSDSTCSSQTCAANETQSPRSESGNRSKLTIEEFEEGVGDGIVGEDEQSDESARVVAEGENALPALLLLLHTKHNPLHSRLAAKQNERN